MIGTNYAPRALVAAASRKIPRRDRIETRNQEHLWSIYENLGPVHYGIGFKRNAATKVDYFAAEIVDDESEPIPTEDRRVVEVLDELGDIKQIVSELVVHTNVVGEGYLVGQEWEGLNSFDVWSSIEVAAAQQPQRHPDDVTELTDSDFVLRVWRSSPRKRSEADAPLRSVAQQCEQLLLLNDQIGAAAMSRLGAGILLVPSELSFPTPAGDPPDTGVNADQDPLMSEIIQIATAPINDSQSASRVAPAVIRGPAEYLGPEVFRHLTFGREIDATFASMREELLRQIAAGLDLPPEIITGYGDLNHWTIWGIDESAAKLHVDPDVLHILQSLTVGYLRPALESLGMSRDEAERYTIWRDYSDLTSRPVSIDQAMLLEEAGIVTSEYVRRIANIPEEDAGEGRPAPVVQLPVVEEESEEGPPPSAVTAARGIRLDAFAEIDGRVAERMSEAAEAAFKRAMDRAGAIARAKVKRDRNFTALIDQVPNDMVLLTLGQERLEGFQLTEDQLLPADTFDSLAARLDKLMFDAQGETRRLLSELVRRDLDPKPEEDEDRNTAVAWFIAALMGIANYRLFNVAPEPDPVEGEVSNEVATGQMVIGSLTIAGGGVDPDTPRQPRPLDVPGDARGLALGQRTRSILRDNGYRFTAKTWKWAYFRTPAVPFDPHLSKNNMTVEDMEDPRLEGYWPGDHYNCTCNFVDTILPI